ncbi:uncharacterized protein RCC_04961 [Ramularia collo-cygni]|uniref:Uncharacterized protein n=1 Tax=Ramularia collo-cygni TaxID=112498 RepID=A0A2D3UXQ0_9PEZI|nr:uncharacterized protein RCC_04961 [Ramularia collo-cygni]CZT19115.1 uncharacterized protein RCC_04961 [Ramularia collo-cygni]
MGDLRAVAVAHSLDRQQMSIIDISTVDLTIHTANDRTTNTTIPKSLKCERQHRPTRRYSTQVHEKVCDVCTEGYVPSGMQWINWKAAGLFCPKCVGKAFTDIIAEEEQYDEDGIPKSGAYEISED